MAWPHSATSLPVAPALTLLPRTVMPMNGSIVPATPSPLANPRRSATIGDPSIESPKAMARLRQIHDANYGVTRKCAPAIHAEIIMYEDGSASYYYIVRMHMDERFGTRS